MLATKTIATILFLSILFTLPSAYSAQKDVAYALDTLEKYRAYLEEGTYIGFEQSYFKQTPQSRYQTFKMVFEHFAATGGKVIVELGTTRSFVHGGLAGCNSDDVKYWTPNEPKNWDWSAGCFTRIVAECLAHLNPQIHTVDITKSHINRCKVITEPFKHLINYHVMSSVDFLENCNFPEGIDLLYMDTGDMTPLEPTALLQLEEAKVVVKRNLIKKGGLILLDDVRNITPAKYGDQSGLGKSKYALPYLQRCGFEIIADEYQVILRKT